MHSKEVETQIATELTAIKEEVRRLCEELAGIRDLAYRGIGSPSDALTEIHRRASRALEVEANR
jgi:hypothetical protein